jgi:integrase
VPAQLVDATPFSSAAPQCFSQSTNLLGCAHFDLDRFPSHRHKGRKPLDLTAVLKRKIQSAFSAVGIPGAGWHTFRHTVGTMLAEVGEHQLIIRDSLRHSNLHVTNKYLQATPESKRLAQDKLVDALLPSGLLSASKATLIQ